MEVLEDGVDGLGRLEGELKTRVESGRRDDLGHELVLGKELHNDAFGACLGRGQSRRLG